MSTVFISLIAILLFGMITVATFTYIDMDTLNASDDAINVQMRLNSAAEVVANYQTSTGSRPMTIAELKNAGLESAGMQDSIADDVSSWSMVCVDGATCNPMDICLVFPDSPHHRQVVERAASRTRGFASGTCGDSNAPFDDNAVITLRI